MASLRASFGFIKCDAHFATPVFFHRSALEPEDGAGAAAGDDERAARSSPPLPAVGARVAFSLTADSRPGKLVAARVLRVGRGLSCPVRSRPLSREGRDSRRF